MRALALAAVLLLAVPGLALAKPRTRTIAPPGNSGIQQYTETVPTSSGGTPSGTIPGGGPGGGAIPSSTAQTLAKSTPGGAGIAALLNATAPAGIHPHHSRHAAGSISDSGGGSPATAVIKALTGSGGSGGLGTLLPIILAACALGLGTAAILRRRRSAA